MQTHELKFWEQVMISNLFQLLSIEHRFLTLHSQEVGLDQFYLKICRNHFIPHNLSTLNSCRIRSIVK